MVRLVLSGGGTGGHFYPLLAFAEYLKREKPEVELLFFGDLKGIEGRKGHLLEKVFDRYHLFRMEKFKGTSTVKKVSFLLKTTAAVLKVGAKLRGKSFKTLLFGGYTSVPAGIFTTLSKRPLFLHEQNAVPGGANVALSKFAKKVFVAFPDAASRFSSKKVEVVGMPVREELKKLSGTPKEEVLKKLKWEGKFTLLVLGGSQGSKKLNGLALEVSTRLEGIRIIHICGERNYVPLREEYKRVKPKAEVVLLPFAENIGELMRVSDVALSRAGASTSFELALFGIPTLFVPYPYAVGDHQYLNALYFAQSGASEVVREENLSADAVLSFVKSLLNDERALKQRSELMKKLFIPDAEEKILSSIGV